MKTRFVLMTILLMVCLSVLSSCDPVYPPGNIKVAKIDPLSISSRVDIKISYPNIGGSIVIGWKDQNVEIISGDDIIDVYGLTITGLKPGTAIIKVNVTTVITDDAVEAGYEEKVYSTEIKIKVK